MYFMVHIIFNNSYYKGRASQVDLVVKNASANAEDVRDLGLIPGSGKAPWRRKWQPTSVFQVLGSLLFAKNERKKGKKKPQEF